MEDDKMAEHEPTDGKRGIFDNPRNVNLFLYGLYAACVLVTVLDFVIHKHPHFKEIETTFPNFYGVYGFIAFCFIVFAGKQLRKLVMRDEDYYDR